MADVIATVRSALTDDVVQRLASAFGEDPGALRRGLDGAVAGVLGDLAAKSRTADGAETIQTALRDAQVDPSLLTELPTRLDGVKLQGRAAGLGLRLLGERGSALADEVAGAAPIKASTATSAVDLAVPLVLAAINKIGGKVSEPGRLQSFLAGQDVVVRRAAPAVAAPVVVGSVAVGSVGVAPVEVAPARVPLSGVVPDGTGWVWLVLGSVPLVALMLLLLRGCGQPPADTPAAVTNTVATATTTTVAPAPAAPAPAPSPPMNTALKAYLQSGDAAPRTFKFDGLHYATASSALGAQDDGTLNELADTLKAFPKAVVRIDGYTDDVGAQARNLGLSKRRAAAVVVALTAKGVDAARMSSDGHGEADPAAPNDTEAGRASNRRTELTVMSK